MVRIYLILLLLGLQLHSHAQLVRRIIVDPNTTYTSIPSYLTSFKDKLVFFAYTKALGSELYALDSGDSVAKLVHDINPGKNGSGGSDRYNMAVLNDVLYFWGSNGVINGELYSWDGIDTPKLEYEFWPGPGIGCGSAEIIAFKDKLYLNATDSIKGKELWVYDPANKSAQRLTDIDTGIKSSSPEYFTVHDEKLYFLAYAPVIYTQLYVYDPATNNTKLVSDIYPGVDFKDAAGLTVIDSVLYFTAKSAAYRRELYHIKDNILERLTDINTSTVGNLGSSFSVYTSTMRPMAKVGNKIYMPAMPDDTTRALYTYEPGTKTATLVYSGDVRVGNPIAYADALFFSGYNQTVGRELFKYDTVNGPYNVADILPGHSFNPDNAKNLYVHNNRLYFTAKGPDIPLNEHLYEYTDTTLVKIPPKPNSIKNTSIANRAHAFPNPCSSELIIEIALKRNEPYYARLTDINGRLVHKTEQKKFNPDDNRIVIPMQSMSTGVYFYSIMNGEHEFMMGGRVVKQ